MDYPLVIVEWVDSAQPMSGWEYIEDIKGNGVVNCLSVGWLIHDNDDVKVIAPNIGDSESSHNQASGVIKIPACCVTKITRLKEWKT